MGSLARSFQHLRQSGRITDALPVLQASTKRRSRNWRGECKRALGFGRDEPRVQSLNARKRLDFRRPASCVAEFRCVRHIIALIAGPPRFEAETWPGSMKLLNPIEQLEQAERILRSAAHIECLAGESVDIRPGKLEGVDQVFDKQPVADLHTVTV